MSAVKPEVVQWIRQMSDEDQVVAFFAYQSLVEEVLHASAPGRNEDAEALVALLGAALTAIARRRNEGGQPASFGDNPFLKAVATQTVEYEHSPRARSNLARLLGWLPLPSAVPYLAQGLADLAARDAVRCALENNPSEAATGALMHAFDTAGPQFCVGVLNSLSRRKGAGVAAVLRRAAEDPHPDVRVAALYGLAEIPDPASAAVLEKGAQSAFAGERRHAHIALIRLASTLRTGGNRDAAARIWQSVLAGDADEPQKNAARLGLGA